MKTSSIVGIISLIITIGGLLVGFGSFVGTTNTSIKYVEEKITVVGEDVKDIKDLMIDHIVISKKRVAKLDEEEKENGSHRIE